VDRRAFFSTLAGGLLASPLVAEAQSAGKMYRVGILSGARSDFLDPLLDVFRQALRDLGYGDSRIVFYVRDAGGRVEDLPRLAGELVSLKVDVIVTASSTPATLAANRATMEIPIVAIAVGAPVLTGLVLSIARPGGNLTGSTILGTEVAPKRLELAKELRPNATTVALLWNPDNPANSQLERELQETAPRQSLKLLSVRVRNADDFETAFRMIARHRPGALLVTGDAMHQAHIDQIIAFAARSRVPTLYNMKENALAGGLMAYAADHRELYRRAATYVDKILKGVKPADLPFEQPTKFELVLNLKTAKALGLTIPQSLLQRADQVIE
jgi:putative ABC transport system substrate-binding protein